MKCQADAGLLYEKPSGKIDYVLVRLCGERASSLMGHAQWTRAGEQWGCQNDKSLKFILFCKPLRCEREVRKIELKRLGLPISEIQRSLLIELRTRRLGIMICDGDSRIRTARSLLTRGLADIVSRIASGCRYRVTDKGRSALKYLSS